MVQKFKTPSARRDHMYSHKPHQFSCDKCKRTFYFLSKLQLHKTSHRRSKLYQCFGSNCKKAYKWKQDLIQHTKRHERDQFNCEECDFLVTEKCLLKRHVLIHGNRKSYCCKKCSKAYRHHNSLNHHAQKCGQ